MTAAQEGDGRDDEVVTGSRRSEQRRHLLRADGPPADGQQRLQAVVLLLQSVQPLVPAEMLTGRGRHLSV